MHTTSRASRFSALSSWWCTCQPCMARLLKERVLPRAAAEPTCGLQRADAIVLTVASCDSVSGSTTQRVSRKTPGRAFTMSRVWTTSLSDSRLSGFMWEQLYCSLTWCNILLAASALRSCALEGLEGSCSQAPSRRKGLHAAARCSSACPTMPSSSPNCFAVPGVLSSTTAGLGTCMSWSILLLVLGPSPTKTYAGGATISGCRGMASRSRRCRVLNCQSTAPAPPLPPLVPLLCASR
mmetsp:Transcript_26966/g.76908  ORF Transcript_26966/g.76908 Transcript_26966/m.76908 type:complete len:238 (+) Transcript_26966:1406-2119(+)